MQSEDLSWLTSVSQKAATASSDFDLNPEVSLDPARSLRTAAVTIMVQQSQFGPRVLLTKRPSTMKHHPGQIAFPGGKSDPTDRDLIQTATSESIQPQSNPYPEELISRGISIPKLKVKGIIFFASGSPSNHIFVSTSEIKNRKVRVGDTVQSATLIHIESNRVVFSYQGKMVHLRIGE